MNSSSLCSLILTLCLILISHSLFLANARAHSHHRLLGNDPNMIGEICKETSKNENNCMTILKADSRITQAKNYFDFSKAVLELALEEGKKGHNFLKGLVKENNTPAILQCANSFYDGVVGSFSSALGELKESPDTANYDAKVAGDGPANCEAALTVAYIVNPAISALNQKISLLSDIAYLATNKLS